VKPKTMNTNPHTSPTEAPGRISRLNCPKCEGRMAEGVVTTKHGWCHWFTPGVVQMGWMDAIYEAKPGERRVKSYACTQCGYVEMYLDNGE
jgi:hypothetical protein